MKNKMEENKENKTIVKVNFSWTYPWLAGWFFTFGITGLEKNLKFLVDLHNTWMVIGYSILGYMFWPVWLGQYLSK